MWILLLPSHDLLRTQEAGLENGMRKCPNLDGLGHTAVPSQQK